MIRDCLRYFNVMTPEEQLTILSFIEAYSLVRGQNDTADEKRLRRSRLLRIATKLADDGSDLTTGPLTG